MLALLQCHVPPLGLASPGMPAHRACPIVLFQRGQARPQALPALRGSAGRSLLLHMRLSAQQLTGYHSIRAHGRARDHTSGSARTTSRTSKPYACMQACICTCRDAHDAREHMPILLRTIASRPTRSITSLGASPVTTNSPPLTPPLRLLPRSDHNRKPDRKPDRPSLRNSAR